MFPTADSKRETPHDSLATFDSSPDLMCVRDLQGRLVRVNKAWEMTLGYAVDEVTNAPLLSLIHPEDILATRLRMEEADRRRDVADFVNRYRRRDGHYRFFKWRAQRVGDVIVGQARDVTAARARGSELQAASQKLRDLLAHISLQVRAPSEDLKRTVDMLHSTRLTYAQHTMLQTLEHSIQALEDVASQLAEIERSDAAWMIIPGPRERGRSFLTHRIEVREPAVAGATVSVTGDPAPRGPADAVSSLNSWISDMVRHQDDSRSLSNCLRDLPSQLLGLLSIRLDHIGDFYPRRLLNLSARSDLMSVGRAAALLRRLKDMSFVDVTGEFKAGQIRPYRVLPPMTQAFAGQLIINLKSLATTDTRAASALEAIEADDQRASPLLAVLAEVMLQDFSMKGPTLAGLLNGASLMAKGRAIALTIGADAIRRNGERLEGRINIGLTAYAERFELSRAHVRRVLQRLEACGLIRDTTSPSMLIVTSRYRDELEKYRAAECLLLSSALARSD